jgi:type IV secretion system protein VirD4
MRSGARWAKLPEVQKAGVFRKSSKAIYVGRYQHPNGRRTHEEMYYWDTRHLLTVGPNRSGKGAGLLMPNLSELRRSLLVIDPKGEAAAQAYMKRKVFGNVLALNPFQMHVDSGWPELKDHGFNPLASLDWSSDTFADEVNAIADAMVMRSNHAKSQHFEDGARDLLGMLIGWVCAVAKEDGQMPGDLISVRKLVMQGMGRDANKRGVGLTELCDRILARGPMGEKDGIPDFIRERAERFGLGIITEELQGVIATAQTQTEFLTSGPMQKSLEGPAFDFRCMRQELTTVFLILPVQELTSKARWLRLVVSLALRQLWQERAGDASVVFALDEFSALGRLQVVLDAMDCASGMGVQIGPIVQDFNQLKQHYHERWESFVANAGLVSGFAAADAFTAEALSKLCGETTIKVPQGKDGAGVQYVKQRLLPYDELMRMPPQEAMTLFRGLKPVHLPYPVRTFAPGHYQTRFARGLRPSPYVPKPLDD